MHLATLEAEELSNESKDLSKNFELAHRQRAQGEAQGNNGRRGRVPAGVASSSMHVNYTSMRPDRSKFLGRRLLGIGESVKSRGTGRREVGVAQLPSSAGSPIVSRHADHEDGATSYLRLLSGD